MSERSDKYASIAWLAIMWPVLLVCAELRLLAWAFDYLVRCVCGDD